MAVVFLSSEIVLAYLRLGHVERAQDWRSIRSSSIISILLTVDCPHTTSDNCAQRLGIGWRLDSLAAVQDLDILGSHLKCE
jgi:hypothetical protein